MNYELAKQLKDAGFSKEIVLGSLENNKDGTVTWIDFPKYPSLSELLEACGDRFEELSRMTHKNHPNLKWGAHAYSCEECGYEGMLSGYGSTKEEAVANLWLELNKK